MLQIVEKTSLKHGSFSTCISAPSPNPTKMTGIKNGYPCVQRPGVVRGPWLFGMWKTDGRVLVD